MSKCSVYCWASRGSVYVYIGIALLLIVSQKVYCVYFGRARRDRRFVGAALPVQGVI